MRKHIRIKGPIRWLILIGLVCILIAFPVEWIMFLRSPNPSPLPPPPADAVYLQSTASIDSRVDDLLSRMTLDEKIGQMALTEKNSIHNLNDVANYGLGAVLSGAGAKPSDNTANGWLQLINGFRQSALRSRLRIPILYGADANHGNGNVPGSTIFPHFIGLGASHDPKLVQSIARATAEEMKATGMNWSYSPTLDLPQDFRWGRSYEAFTDDPALASKLGAAYVRGTQETSTPMPLAATPMDIGVNATIDVIATAKHYIGAGGMQWGSSSNKDFKIDQGKTMVSEEEIQAHYLPPFKAAVDAGALSVMVGLNQVNGEWISYDHHLVTGVLKGELGFKGFVVSDWYGAYEHSSTQYEGMVKAVNAGVDMIMLPFDYQNFVMNMRLAVKTGDISESRIDDAVRRILFAKFSAGLFDRSQPTQAGLSVIGSADHHALAREAVAKSAVLLKNDRVLPLSPKIGHILVAGSSADNVGRQCGAWTVEWQGVDGNWLLGGTSILAGIKQTVSSSTIVEYDRDAHFANTDEKADIGIAIVGEKPFAEGWGDNANPTLDQNDLDTIARLKEASKKVIVVLVSGRPLIITNELPKWDALVEAWLPGSEGEGIADVLFGKKPFTGTLPLPWPASVSQLPINVDQKTADGTKPLFPRDFGIR
ncbi:MAG: glycoside hydrolase family 3 N-terminal domain-containing protein [Patescibacteria group bacterium]